jgi:antitoxin (DNA-binding transcriptional repressor) of toxin-antitoxin stability system
MRAVGIKVLKNRLSEYVRLAAAGESVLVTDRDRGRGAARPAAPQRAEAVSDALLADRPRGLDHPGSFAARRAAAGAARGRDDARAAAG